MHSTSILGIPFTMLTQPEAVNVLTGWLDTDKNHIIVTPNPEGVMQARRNPDFAHALKSADLSLADGTGIVLASYIRGPRLPGRVRGVDTIFALFEAGRKITAYFLGGKPGVAEAAKANMEARFSNLSVIGYHHGYFESDTEITNEINKLNPDIVLVCTGMPRAELWAAAHRDINTRLTLCLGGTIDIMAGSAKMAPAWMRKIGLEWLYRLIRQPSRFWRMLDIPRFVFALIFKGK